MKTKAVAGRAPGHRRLIALAALAALVLGLWAGCREEEVIEVDTNLPPDTYLTCAPPESSSNLCRIHVYWHGEDPDGEVVGFYVAVTDSMPVKPDTISFRFTRSKWLISS